jgi:peptidoglycan hydrolase-like protein with peptidoglycan-binding domain
MSDAVIKAIQQRLNRFGFGPIDEDGLNGPATRLAVARFQLAYNLGKKLDVDGQYGPMTLAALDETDKIGRISPRFALAEVRSKGDRTAYVHRDLLVALEALRSRVGRPLSLVSCWRDVAHNRRVGGATGSQHTYGAAPELQRLKDKFPRNAILTAGRAADFNRGYITLEDAQGLNLFSGLGWRLDGGKRWVTHVDIRTDRSPKDPSIWRYG